MNVNISKMDAKKAKNYHFNREWQNEFLFHMVKDKCVCLICNSTVALPKKGNVERHFRSMHKGFNDEFPLGSEIRKVKVEEMMRSTSTQQLFFTRENSKTKNATLASFKVAEILMKNKKSFEDGELVKEAFVKAGEVLFADFKNKSEIMSAIKDVPLSRNTIMRRSEMIGKDLDDLLKSDLNRAQYLSLQFDESTDFTDIAQLCVFVKMVFPDMTSKEEFLTLIPLKDQTRGQDIYDAFKEYVNIHKFPVHKLVSMTTDGAPAMVGRHAGFVALCKEDEEMPTFTSYHCIIHQQVLTSKILDSNDVMTPAFKIVNSIRSRSLRRRQFRLLLEECGAQNGDLLLHTDVRWLSRAKFLKRFRSLLPNIKEFLTGRKEDWPQLEDESWLMKLAFLCDVTELLNVLNLNLQGKNKTLMEMVSLVNHFKEKINHLAAQLRSKNFNGFECLLKESENVDVENIDWNRFADQLVDLSMEFENRFNDFKQLENILIYLANPFKEIQVDEVNVLAQKISSLVDGEDSEIEDEILKIRCDLHLKAQATVNNCCEYWNFLAEEKYPYLRKLCMYITAFFGSTYLCEATFSTMNSVKTKFRNKITDAHLLDCIRIAVTSYEVDHKKLTDGLQCQKK